MSSGLLALLDDVAAIAKLAAASLDDAAGQAAKATAKSAGIVIDDTAVTPRYVVGFAADRELPIVGRIAYGSLRNKLLFLLPGALFLSYFAPWAITPLLMAGGAFLCFEGYEKLAETWRGTDAKSSAAETAIATASSAQAVEDERVAGAIRTDMILSAEIMAIALSAVAGSTFLVQALSLLVVALVVTGGVYGLVALIVKADDFGVALAQRPSQAAQRLGQALVTGMPRILAGLSALGMLAMLWVGGGIILHGLAHYGLDAPEHALTAVSTAIGGAIPFIGGLAGWLVAAAGAGVFGTLVGAVVEAGVRAFGGDH
jgi:predicted DNA repair protein MutK